jgi:hypothetical protein
VRCSSSCELAGAEVGRCLPKKGSDGSRSLAFAGAFTGDEVGKRLSKKGNVKTKGLEEVVEDAEEEGMVTVTLAIGFCVGAELGLAEMSEFEAELGVGVELGLEELGVAELALEELG